MTNMNSNMAIWDQVKETDTRYTRQAKLNGQDMTSINGLYIVRRATELFGPVGKGWGWKVLVERFDEGAPHLDKNGAVICHDKTHTLYIELWYRHDGTINHARQYGHTPTSTRPSGASRLTTTTARSHSPTPSRSVCRSSGSAPTFTWACSTTRPMSKA